MAKQSVNIGTTANDNTGDPLRTAFNKLNSNHDEIYAAGPVGTNLQVASNTIASTNSNGNIKLDPIGTGTIELAGPINAQGVLTLGSTVTGNILPTANVTTNLGSDTVRFSEVHGNVLHVGSLILREVSNTLEIFTQDNSTNAILNGNSTTSGSVLANGNSFVQVNANGNIQLFANTLDSANATTINTANITSPEMISVGNMTGGNLITAGVATATGNVTGGNLITAGLASVGTSVTAGTTITATGNITGGNLITAGLASVGTSVTAGTTITATGNVTGGNVITAGLASVGTSVTAGTTITATGNITGGNLITAGSTAVTGNITGGNITTAGITNTASTTYSGDSTSQTTAWKPSAVILTADGSGITNSMTNFFANSLSLTSGKYYEIKMHLVFENSSTGLVSMQLTDSGTAFETFALQAAFMDGSGTFTATAPITGTGTFGAGSNSAATHSGHVNGTITVSGATNLNLQASVASGTITPKKGSFMRVIEYSAGTVGSTA